MRFSSTGSVRIKALLFDCDGVIIDSEPVWDRGQTEFLSRRGLDYDRDRLKPLLTGNSIMNGTAVMKRELGLEGDVGDLARERVAIVLELFRTEVDFIPGFAEFFAEASNRYECAIVSGITKVLWNLVDARLGLSARFGARVFTNETTGAPPKPAPDLFLLAAERLGVSAESCLVIEDAPLGIKAARAAGMKSIALATTYAPEVLALELPDRVVSGFAEIDPDRPLGDPRQGAAAGDRGHARE